MPNDLDLMIKRLEEANARAYEKAHEKAARVDERVSVSDDEVASPPSDQRKQPAVPNRRISRGGLALGLVGSLLVAASFGVVAFWESPYGDAAKQTVARWALPLDQTTSQDVAAAAQMFPELAHRIQTMERDLANVAQGIERLKNSQEELTRDNATATEQLKAALSQLTLDNAAIIEQLKASQEQTARPGAPRMSVRVEPPPEARIRRLDAY